MPILCMYHVCMPHLGFPSSYALIASIASSHSARLPAVALRTVIELNFWTQTGVLLMFTLRRSALRASHAFRPTLQARVVSTSSQTPQNPLKKGLYATVFAVSAGLFAVYYFDSRSAIHRYIITPTLRYALDPETSHRVAVRALASGLGPRDTQADDERLKLEVFSIHTALKARVNVARSALGNAGI